MLLKLVQKLVPDCIRNALRESKFSQRVEIFKIFWGSIHPDPPRLAWAYAHNLTVLLPVLRPWRGCSTHCHCGRRCSDRNHTAALWSLINISASCPLSYKGMDSCMSWKMIYSLRRVSAWRQPWQWSHSDVWMLESPSQQQCPDNKQ